jgi:hypothetical protein
MAHYQIRYGEMPLDTTLAMVDAPTPNEEQLKLLVLGMENLVGVLGPVMSGLGETQH